MTKFETKTLFYCFYSYYFYITSKKYNPGITKCQSLNPDIEMIVRDYQPYSQTHSLNNAAIVQMISSTVLPVLCCYNKYIKKMDTNSKLPALIEYHKARI